MRRLGCVLVLAALLLAAPAAAVVPEGAEYEQVFFESADGVRLHADVLKPARLQPGQRTPVLMTITPYNAHSRDGATAQGPATGWLDFAIAIDAWKRGYTVVVVDVRGFGGSQGCWQNGGPLEQADAKAAVEWAAGQPWSNGRVALAGLSYDAWSGVMAMATGARGLVAVVSWSGVVDPYRVLYDHRVPTWSQAAYPLGYDVQHNNQPGTTADQPEYAANWATRALSGCSTSQAAEIQESNPHVDYWRDRDLVERAAESDVPVWASQGFLDIQVPADQTLSLYPRLRNRRTLLLGQFVHYQPVMFGGEVIGRESLESVAAFLDERLRGERAASKDPAVTVQEAPSLRWRTEQHWPPRDVGMLELGLARGRYVDRSGNHSGDDFVATTLPAPLPASSVPTTGDGSWTFSPPLARETHIAGAPRLEVHALGEKEARVVALLYDVDPDGKAFLITRGASVLGDGTVRIPLLPQDWRVAAGHRIGLLLSGADDGWYVPHEGTGLPVTVQSGTLGLPVLQAPRDRFIPGGPGISWAQVKRPIQVEPGTIDARTVQGPRLAAEHRQAVPRLRLRVAPVRAPAGRPTTFRFTVTSEGRPVRGASVSFAGLRRRTGADGRVRLKRRPRLPGWRRASARKPGYRQASLRVRVTR